MAARRIAAPAVLREYDDSKRKARQTFVCRAFSFFRAKPLLRVGVDQDNTPEGLMRVTRLRPAVAQLATQNLADIALGQFAGIRPFRPFIARQLLFAK